MILSDKNIKEALARGDITIDPFNEKYLQPMRTNIEYYYEPKRNQKNN